MPDTIKPVSAATSKPLTPVERQQRFAELRRRMGKSQIEVTPPAGKVGYWVDKDDIREIGRLRWLGWEIVHDDPKQPAWTANGAQSDGTYVIGDVILMEIDQDSYDLIQEEYLSRHSAMMENTRANFASDAGQQGVPVFEVDKSKSQPQQRR